MPTYLGIKPLSRRTCPTQSQGIKSDRRSAEGRSRFLYLCVGGLVYSGISTLISVEGYLVGDKTYQKIHPFDSMCGLASHPTLFVGETPNTVLASNTPQVSATFRFNLQFSSCSNSPPPPFRRAIHL